jgi:hypothetical protein
MSNPSTIYTLIFVTAPIFLILEAVFATLNEMKRSDKTTLSQATAWIKSILMIVLASIMLMLLRSTVTDSVSV